MRARRVLFFAESEAVKAACSCAGEEAREIAVVAYPVCGFGEEGQSFVVAPFGRAGAEADDGEESVVKVLFCEAGRGGVAAITGDATATAHVAALDFCLGTSSLDSLPSAASAAASATDGLPVICLTTALPEEIFAVCCSSTADEKV